MHNFWPSVSTWLDQVATRQHDPADAIQQQWSTRMFDWDFNRHASTTRKIRASRSVEMNWKWVKLINWDFQNQPKHTIVGDDVSGAAGVLENVAVGVQLLDDSHLEQLFVPNVSLLRYAVQNHHGTRLNLHRALPQLQRMSVADLAVQNFNVRIVRVQRHPAARLFPSFLHRRLHTLVEIRSPIGQLNGVAERL